MMEKTWSEEFSDTEKFMSIEEKLFGEYVWGIYDLLVLPPSFPYGGMENPCLTFVTPTLLAGDRSLADVVAHEITHSTSTTRALGLIGSKKSLLRPFEAGSATCAPTVVGPLGTCGSSNCREECFWLNEGFTKFGEDRIMGNMNGKEARPQGPPPLAVGVYYCIIQEIPSLQLQ